MKTIKWVLTTLALFIAAIGFATETPKMNVISTDAGRVQVYFESQSALPIEINITGRDGGLLYCWQSENPETRVNKQFNLSELGQGNFNVSLNYGGKSANWELCIRRHTVTIGQPVQLNEPFFCFKNDRLDVSFLNAAQKNVYLNIYKDGEHYEGLTLGKDFDIQKCLDFSKAAKGNYKIVLTDNFKEHYFAVNK